MKIFLGFAMMLALLSADAFAGRNFHTVNIPEPMKAGPAQLAAGDYNITWTGTGNNIPVTFSLMQNRKVIVTIPAQVIAVSNKNEGLDIKTTESVETLESIRMKDLTLVFEALTSSQK